MTHFTVHSVEKREILSHLKSKTVTFTKFLPKMRECEFPYIPHCVMEVTKISNNFGKNFVKVTFLLWKLLES